MRFALQDPAYPSASVNVFRAALVLGALVGGLAPSAVYGAEVVDVTNGTPQVPFPAPSSINSTASKFESHLPEECLQPPRASCTFYATCLEPLFQCGPTGYPLALGGRFCEEFKEAEETFSKPQGERWLWDTMQCLKQGLVEDVVEMERVVREFEEERGRLVNVIESGHDEDSRAAGAIRELELEMRRTRKWKCAEVMRKGYELHSGCYIGGGFCELGVKDWMAIVDIVGLGRFVETAAARKETWEITVGCSKRWGRAIADKVKGLWHWM